MDLMNEWNRNNVFGIFEFYRYFGFQPTNFAHSISILIRIWSFLLSLFPLFLIYLMAEAFSSFFPSCCIWSFALNSSTDYLLESTFSQKQPKNQIFVLYKFHPKFIHSLKITSIIRKLWLLDLFRFLFWFRGHFRSFLVHIHHKPL